MIQKKTEQERVEDLARKIAEAKDLLNDVQSKIGTVLTPERYLSFLDIVERFHWYSHINNLLILFQYPTARYLAGFKTWKQTSLSIYNDETRKLLKPEHTGKAIKLLAPFTFVKGATRSLFYVIVPVYDVSQMNDIPSPVNDFLDIRKCDYVDIINAIKFTAPYRTVFASGEDQHLSYNVKAYCNHRAEKTPSCVGVRIYE